LEGAAGVSTAERATDAVSWAVRQLGWSPPVENLPGDLSPRRYRRLVGSGYLLATHPAEDLESLKRFVQTTTLLERVGVRVPRLRNVDVEAGWLLVEDLGARTLFEAAPTAAALEQFLDQAVGCTVRISSLDLTRETTLLTPLGPEALMAELDKTIGVGLVPLGYLPAGQVGEFRASLVALCERITRKMVPAHRDFMIRNLVPLDDGVGVLDHQDLRLAPAAYDLASLLVDSVVLEPETRSRLEGRLIGPELRAQWLGVASQRCLKILGTFLGFAARGVPRHLPLCRETFVQLARLGPEVPELERWSGDLEAWAQRAAEDARFCAGTSGGRAVVC
jgi:aminoglycoside/choline kinase family phosphotransferase